MAFPTIRAYLLRSANTELTDAGGPLTRDVLTAWLNGAHSGTQTSGWFSSLHSVPILECVLLWAFIFFFYHLVWQLWYFYSYLVWAIALFMHLRATVRVCLHRLCVLAKILNHPRRVFQTDKLSFWTIFSDSLIQHPQKPSIIFQYMFIKHG